jgi:hypothetical protein
MRGTVIAALLSACAEAPGMPAYLRFDDALTDGNEHPPEQSEGTPTDLAEIGEEPRLESSTPDVDETAISEDVPGGNPESLVVQAADRCLRGRYLRRSIEVGRTPSLLGGSFF